MHISRKVFYSALIFIIGVVAAGLKINPYFSIATLGIILLFFILWNKKTSIFLFILPAVIGFAYYTAASYLDEEKIIFDSKIEFSGIIENNPKSLLKSQSFEVNLSEPYKGLVRVYTALYPEFEYGDSLSLSGIIKKSPSGKINIVNFPEISLISQNNKSAIRSFLFYLKDRLIENIQRVLPIQRSSLLSGILLGDRAEFSDEFKESLNKTGTTHIVALSGYNIAIIATSISILFSRFWGRRLSLYATVTAIMAFVLMTGAEPSVVRAAIMGIILVIAQKYGRSYDVRNAIIFSALFMILINHDVFFDVGFQLSFAALLGLIFINPIIIKFVQSGKVTDGFMGWRKILSQTISAQLGAFPIIIYNFGYLSPWSIITNLLILPIMPATMSLGFLTAFSGFISHWLSLMIAYISGVLLSYEIFIINFFSFNWI